MNLTSFIETPRRMWDGLSDRERRLVAALGAVFAGLLIFIPLFLVLQQASSTSSENEEIRKVLKEINQNQGILEKRGAARRAAERRFATRAPDLSAFLEEQGQRVGLTVARTQPQPNAEVPGFTRRGVKVDLPDVPLRPAAELIAAVENSQYPVAVDEIQISHTQMGVDRFSVKLGVVAFDKHPEKESAKSEP
ncbi:MAG: type II secretion system protein M [Myxococcales bacterium]|nr:MAG: type II secretion system protein M [Myxococcales bacterium]